jgi:hypothetical protein
VDTSSQPPDPHVRADAGGWISGPCLPLEALIPAADPGWELLQPYRGQWDIERYPGGLLVWSAVRRSADGHHVHALVAHSAEELAGKLAVTDEVDGES